MKTPITQSQLSDVNAVADLDDLPTELFLGSSLSILGFLLLVVLLA